MNVIFGQQMAAQLSQDFIVLNLPDIHSSDAFVVINRDQIDDDEIPHLLRLRDLHNQLVDSYQKGDREFSVKAVKELYGHFKGELDSFYDHILKEFDGESSI